MLALPKTIELLVTVHRSSMYISKIIQSLVFQDTLMLIAALVTMIMHDSNSNISDINKKEKMGLFT